MKAYRCVKTNRLNQAFGEDRACLNPPTGKVVTRTSQTCPHGFKSLYGHYGMDGHNGKDWGCWHGEPVYFSIDSNVGWFARDASDTDGGIGVDVISKEPVTLTNKKTGETRTHHIKMRYWHALEAWKDKDIEFGEMVMLGDNTGSSSGDHVHEGFKFCEADGTALYKDNGYYGAENIDDWMEFENRFVGEVVKVKKIQLSLIDKLKKVVSLLRLMLKRV